MDIRIQPLQTSAGPRWQVCIDKQGVSFRSEREAREFVNRLEERLKAPHPLPWRPGQLRSAS